jgi:hypothetical protein
VIYFGSWNIILKHYDTILIAEEKGELLTEGKEKTARNEKNV